MPRDEMQLIHDPSNVKTDAVILEYIQITGDFFRSPLESVIVRISHKGSADFASRHISGYIRQRERRLRRTPAKRWMPPPGDWAPMPKPLRMGAKKWVGENVDFSVLGPGEAKMGGKTLARFQEGIRDSRNVGTEGLSKVHQSVLGHSYGSTTASYGVAQVRPSVVDEFAVFGSPGVKDGSWQMNTPVRHNYVLRFADDDIGSGNTLKRFLVGKDTRGWFGTDPYLDGGFKKLDPYGLNTKETEHSGCLADGSDLQLQLARVITGKMI